MSDALQDPPGQLPQLGELDADSLRAYLLGSLAQRAGRHPDSLTLKAARALGWYRALVLRGGARGLLLSWVYDLGWLLIDAEQFPFASLEHLDQWSEEERPLRLQYENRLLNSVLRDPSTRRGIELLRRDTSRDDLIARMLELILAPLLKAGGYPGAPLVDPVLLRELSLSGELRPEEFAESFAELAGEGFWNGALSASLETFFAGRRSGRILSAADLSEVEHWSAYRKRAQRMAGRRIIGASEAFPTVDPTGVKVQEEEEADTELPDSGYYPEGGFAELTNRGPIENLHPAELVYMREDPFGHDPDPPIDLFAIRVLENEALFFQRDSGQLRRTRRTVHLAVAPDQGLRLKLKWHDEALAIYVYGFLVRLIEDLSAIFPRDALRVEMHIVAPSGDARERAEADCELLSVLLRHEIARDAASISLAPEDFDLRALGEPERRVYGIAIQSGAHDPAGLPPGPAPLLPEGAREPRILTWRIGGEEPGPDELDVVQMPVEGDPRQSMVRARDALLAEIAGIKGRGVRAVQARRRPKRVRQLPKGLRADAQGRPTGVVDQSVLVWVPPGTYPLGTPEADPARNLLDAPRSVRLERGFYMGLLPVTWGQYRAFCAATGRVAPEPLFPVEDDHPAHRVPFKEAEAYARWAGLRLPSEDEWEIAARGKDGRSYPWGEEDPSPRRAVYGREADGREGWTAPVGKLPEGASPVGCLDMSGNVWEWVTSGVQARSGRVARGGCWNAPPWDCRTVSRTLLRKTSQFVGFRVAL